MKTVHATYAVGLAFLTCFAAACGSESKPAASTVTPAAATPQATVTVRPPGSTTTPLVPFGTAIPIAPTVPIAQPTASPGAPGTRLEPAPIDGAELIIEESNPVQYAVHITSGLPSGCHVFDHATLTRNGTSLTIEVMNRLPADPRLACTAIYGTHKTTVQLGSDFARGTAYTVRVNDRTLEFTAQ